MPPPVQTPQQIVDTLNTGLQDSPWIYLSHPYVLVRTDVQSNHVNFNLSEGAIVVAFLNQTTGEMKLYLAKLLDVDFRDHLWNQG